MSEFRSSGSNYFPCSQSRKMSIGVLVGSPPERNLEPNKGDGNALPRVEKLNSATAADLEMNKKDKNNSAVNHVNPAQAPDHLTSPWRSPRTSYKKLGTLENVLSKQTSNLSYSKGTWKGLNEVNQAPAAYSVQRHPVATFQSNDCKSNRYVRKKGNGGLSERMEESTPVVSQEKVTSEGMAMDKPDNAENGSTDALRTKLWEILGKGSSPKKQHSNSEVPEVVDNNSDLRQDKDPNGDPLVKPRHNSDPIETDSESPVNATQRPVTRSLLLKRVSGKETQKKPKAGANLGRKKIEQENNIFSFEEGLLGKIDPAMNVSSMPKKQKTGRRTVNQCRKAHSLEKVDAEGILREKDKHEILPSENVRADKTSSLSNTKGRFGGFAYKDKAPLQKLQSDIREEDFHQPQAKETSTKPGILRGTSESRGKHEGLSNPFKENPVEPLDDFHSPTLGYPTPICSPSPCFSPAVTPSHLSDNSPMLEETETPIFSFGTKKNSQTACQATNTEQESSDFLEKSRDYRYRRDSSAEPIEDSVGLSESSSDERDSNGSEEDSHAMRHYHYSGEEERRNSLHGCRRKSLFVLHSAQRNSNPAGTRLDEPSPTLSSPKGIHETDCFPGSSELNGDDGLGRAITLFALALQNFEKKLKSAARKRSSEIIASVSEEINLQMGSVQSHILTDVRKLSNLTKTKRKHAETRVQEKQEKLRMIREKLKDEISHNLEDFKSSIEELEANQTELKGTIKRQKASHQKLITQLEGEVEAQLVNATRRISAVNESARAKMVQLKKIVAECFKDEMVYGKSE